MLCPDGGGGCIFYNKKYNDSMNERINHGENSGQKDNGYQSLSMVKDEFDPEKALHLRQERQGAKNQETSAGSLKDFYDALRSPIDSDETLLAIIGAYAKKNNAGLGGLYSSLQKVGTEQKESGREDSVASQKFEEKMYARWRHSVVDMTKEEFIDAKAAGTLDEDFRLLHLFVKNHPECSTESELMAAMDQVADKDVSKRLSGSLERYNWNLKTSGWTHVKSRYVNARQEDRINVEHRFYLNTDSISTHAVADALVDCYEKSHLPYYFKFDDGPGNRADTIVIYTSTEELTKNLGVLRQLKKERPDLAKHFHQPPVLTGVIDDNIGYGSEPEAEESSYSSVRATLLEKVLDSATIDWVSAHQNDRIRYGDKMMPFSAYVAEKETEKLQHDFSRRFSYYLENERQNQQDKNGRIDEAAALKNVTKKLGFNQQDLQDGSKMFDFIKSEICKNFPAIMKSFQATGKCSFEIDGRYDRKIQLGEGNFMATLEGIAPKIALHDKTYLDDIRRRIRKMCAENGIDPDKFVFDKSTIIKMKKQNHAERNRLG